ncbi:MAG: tetratricopeptide repeat protein, partial [Bdellovibrionales bacterium]|nr:tetratricopeptide repeat protein [Bdellovibrionales bacterium]
SSAKEETLYREAISKCPSMPESYYNLAVLLEKKGDLKGAVTNFAKASEIRPGNRFDFAHAHALVKLGNLSQAKDIYQSYIEKDKDSLEALVGLAHIKSVEGKTEDAITDLYKAKDIDSKNLLVLYNLAVLLERLQRFDEAMVFYDSAIAVDNKHLDSQIRAGLVSLELNDCARGAKYLETAAGIDSNNLTVLRALGVCYERLKLYERAELSLNKALKLEPQDVSTSVNLAIVLIKTKRESMAEEILLKIEESKRTAKLYSALGWAQLELGKYRDSEKNLRSALQDNSSDKIALENLKTLYRRTGREESIESILTELNLTEKSEILEK